MAGNANIKVASDIGNGALGTCCLVFTEANNGSEFRMPKWPMANYC